MYENPFKFQFDSWKTDEEATKIMKEIISPRVLPVNFTTGKDIYSYEFYNPSVAARQLGFGQVPPSLFFVSKIQFREAHNSALSYCNTRFIKGHKPSNYIRARIKSHVYTTE